MQVTEVRLGNLVAYKNHYQTPEVVAALNKESEKINGHDAKDFSGIPLNEQWLEDFGFERHYNGKNCDYAKYGVGLCYEVDDDSWWYSGHPKSCIKYVHQLQNLFYCLTGQELELKKQ